MRITLGAVLTAGAIMLGGTTSLCLAFTANALLDTSPSKEVPVVITGMIQVTHNYVFREYKIEYQREGNPKDQSLMATPQNMAHFVFPVGVAVEREGWLGWRWVESIEPVLPEITGRDKAGPG